MAGRRGKYGQPAQPFESVKDNDRFIRIFDGMRKSAAWQDLSASARGLYLEIKAEYCPKYHDGSLISENHSAILFPASTWQKLYGKNGDKSWKRDRDALITHGFIKMDSNKHIRKPNVYKLSSEWQTWKPPP